jgi:hypothetical protein
MLKEMAFPEFIGETEQAVIMVIPSLAQDLSVLYRRFHEGEEIDYWFNWELTSVRHNEYMVTLKIGWDEDDLVSIGFTLDMWEYLPLITKKSNVVLMTDWRLLEEGILAGMDNMGRFRPQALLVRNVGHGMEGLSDRVAEQVMFRENNAEMLQLFEILQSGCRTNINIH